MRFLTFLSSYRIAAGSTFSHHVVNLLADFAWRVIQFNNSPIWQSYFHFLFLFDCTVKLAMPFVRPILRPFYFANWHIWPMLLLLRNRVGEVFAWSLRVMQPHSVILLWDFL